VTRILVVAPNWIGDALMAQPLLALLKGAGAAIDVLAPEWVAPVLRRMPEVAEVITVPLRHGALQLGQRWKIGRALKGKRYPQAIVLPNTWKSALVPFFAGIPRRTGYTGEARFGLLNDRHGATPAPMAEHYAGLAGPLAGTLPRPTLAIPADEISAAKRRFGIEGPYAALCPGAEYGSAKRWPYFADLARALPLRPVLLGSAKDASAAGSIPGTDLMGKTSLDEAIALLAGADTVISNDSGLMHVAAALGRPMVALFGSSSPEHTPPRSPAAKALWLRLECSPCYQRECPLGHFRCMKDMSVEMVLDALKTRT
jgi:heptosyltransferase II